MYRKMNPWVSLIALLLLLVIMVFVLTGCSGATVKREGTAQKQEEETTSMFVLVEDTHSWVVVYHRETKVMYVVSDSAYSYGIFTVLVNADGTPMTWEG